MEYQFPARVSDLKPRKAECPCQDPYVVAPTNDTINVYNKFIILFRTL